MWWRSRVGLPSMRPPALDLSRVSSKRCRGERLKQISYTLPSASLEVPFAGAQATVGFGQVQVSTGLEPLDIRHAIGGRLDRLDENKQGVLITLDELGVESPMEEVRAFATAIQHLIREERNIAVVFAGIPSMVDDVVNDKVLTFLRRAERFHLRNVRNEDVWSAFEHTISENGKRADYGVLNALTLATHGYPFMIQLVGHQAWRISESAGHDDEITLDDAQQGIEKARDRIGELVNGPAVDGLPPMARAYLMLMAVDDGPSNTTEIAHRMQDPAICECVPCALDSRGLHQTCGSRLCGVHYAVHARVSAAICGIQSVGTKSRGYGVVHHRKR